MIARGSGASFCKPGASATGDNSSASYEGVADLRPQYDPDTHVESSQSAARRMRSARTSWRGDDLFDPQRLNSASKLVAIDNVTVADQIWLSLPFNEGFDHLLRDPFGARMFRDSEMKYLPPLMLQHEKHKQNLQTEGRHG